MKDKISKIKLKGDFSENAENESANRNRASAIDLEGDFSEDADEDSQKDKYLTFHIANEGYAVEVQYVTEIIGIQRITEVPDMPNFVKGVINLRGKIIPVIDVRIRFMLEPKEYDVRTCIIVVNISDLFVGLVVDEVSEVADIPESQVEPPPRVARKKGGQFIQGMGKIGEKVKIILSVNNLLLDEELGLLKATAPESAVKDNVA